MAAILGTVSSRPFSRSSNHQKVLSQSCSPADRVKVILGTLHPTFDGLARTVRRPEDNERPASEDHFYHFPIGVSANPPKHARTHDRHTHRRKGREQRRQAAVEREKERKNSGIKETEGEVEQEITRCPQMVRDLPSVQCLSCKHDLYMCSPSVILRAACLSKQDVYLCPDNQRLTNGGLYPALTPSLLL